MTIPHIREVLTEIYQDADALGRFVANYRPVICPFHVLIDWIPQGSTVLDVGCGSGLFLNLLAAEGRIASGFGIDASASAIEMARMGLTRINREVSIDFEHRGVEEGLGDDLYDVVSLCDVLHHVPPAAQRQAIEAAASRVRPGGVLLYKDMADRPFWRATANRLHDLVMAKEWIHYVPVSQVESWLGAAGFTTSKRETIDMLWYRHDLRLFHPSAEDQ